MPGVVYPERVDGEAGVYERWAHERHGPALQALNADPEVARFLGGVAPPEASDALSAGIEAHWDAHGFGLWAAVAEGECVGFTGACHPGSYWPAELRSEVELGWRLARHAWGRGLATEGAGLAKTAALESLGLARVVAFVDPENERSIAVTRRLGMRTVGEARGGRDELVSLLEATR